MSIAGVCGRLDHRMGRLNYLQQVAGPKSDLEIPIPSRGAADGGFMGLGRLRLTPFLDTGFQ